MNSTEKNNDEKLIELFIGLRQSSDSIDYHQSKVIEAQEKNNLYVNKIINNYELRDTLLTVGVLHENLIYKIKDVELKNSESENNKNTNEFVLEIRKYLSPVHSFMLDNKNDKKGEENE